jgi:hypothetical protein
MFQIFRKALLAAALLAFPATGCAIQLEERSLIRPVAAGPISAEAVSQIDPQLTLERHEIVTSDGNRLAAVLLRRPGAAVTILYFGGNQFTVGMHGAYATRLLAPLQTNLMLVDYRGYGRSQGSPTAANLHSDGLEVFDYLARLPGIQPGSIVVHGQSLGSFIAGHVAALRETAGVVLESSVTTTEEWVAGQSRGIQVRIAPALVGQGNQRNMPRIEEPLLLLVGSRDTTTPPAMSQALYRQSPLPAGLKTLVIVDGADHNNVLTMAAAQQAYRAFLSGRR